MLHAAPRYSRRPSPLLRLIKIHEELRNLEVPLDDPSSQTLQYGVPRGVLVVRA
jgi:hypothetical protein